MKRFLLLLTILILGFFIAGLLSRMKHKKNQKERDWASFIHRPVKDLVQDIGSYTYVDSITLSAYPSIDLAGKFERDEMNHLIIGQQLEWAFDDTSKVIAYFELNSPNISINYYANKLDTLENPIKTIAYIKGDKITVFRENDTQITANTNLKAYIGKPLKLLLQEFPLLYTDRVFAYPESYEKEGHEWDSKEVSRIVIRFSSFFSMNVIVAYPSPEDVLYPEVCAPIPYSENSRNFDLLEKASKANILYIDDIKADNEKEILENLAYYKMAQIHFPH